MVGQDRVTLRTVYLYLVCLAMLVISVLAVVQLVRSAQVIAYPDVAPSFSWTAYTPLEQVSGERFLSEEQRSQVAADVQRRPAIRDAVTAGSAPLLAGGIFALHWRRTRSEPAAPAEAPTAPRAN